MKKLRNYIQFLQELADTSRNEWQVALRKRTEKPLYEGDCSTFYAVKNTLRYWFADPFIFSQGGKDYLFVEMFDRWKEKGVIGVSQIRNGKCGKFRVCLELPWHLSYPCVFADDEGIHMIPECSQSKEVWIWRCVKFPRRWEKERKLMDGCAADTTPFWHQNKRFWLTTRFESFAQYRTDNLWQIDDGDGSACCLAENVPTARGAGNLICDGDLFIRPSQNCTNRYGENLVFNKGCVKNGIYQEVPFLRALPPGNQQEEKALRVICQDVTGTCIGMHTYNCNKQYEVIDLRLSGNRNTITLLKNLTKHLAKKLGK